MNTEKSLQCYWFIAPVQDDVMEETCIKGFKPESQAEILQDNLVGLRVIMDMTSKTEKHPKAAEQKGQVDPMAYKLALSYYCSAHPV